MHASFSSYSPPVVAGGRDDAGSSSSSRSMSRLPARVAGAVARGIVTFVFATVGTILGAITGGLIGLATESGMVRGTGIGAISGAVVAMEVVDSSVAMWCSHDSGIWSVLYVVRLLISCQNLHPLLQLQFHLAAETMNLHSFLLLIQLIVPISNPIKFICCTKKRYD